MESEAQKFKRLNDEEETHRLFELRNKQLSDMNTNLEGVKVEGIKISTDRAIKNLLSKRPDMTTESIGELLEVDISQVERLKNEKTNLKEN